MAADLILRPKKMNHLNALLTWRQAPCKDSVNRTLPKMSDRADAPSWLRESPLSGVTSSMQNERRVKGRLSLNSEPQDPLYSQVRNEGRAVSDLPPELLPQSGQSRSPCSQPYGPPLGRVHVHD